MAGFRGSKSVSEGCRRLDPAFERTACGGRPTLRLRLIVVLHEKLPEVMGGDVTPEQAFAHAIDVLNKAVGGDIGNSGDIRRALR